MKKVAYLACVIILLANVVVGQSEKSLQYYDQKNDFDSLKIVVDQSGDLTPELAYYLARSYNSIESGVALSKTDSILALPIMSGNTVWIDRTKALRITFLQKTGNYNKVISEGRSLLNKLDDSFSKFDIAHNISISFRRINTYDSALKWGLPLLDLSQKLNDDLRKHRALQNLANLYDVLGERHKTLNYERELIQIAKGLGNDDLRILDLCNLGSSFVNNGMYDSADYYFDEALALAEETNNEKRKPLILYNQASLEEELGNYRIVIQIINKCLPIARNTNQPTVVSIANYLKALSLYKLGQIENAEEIIQEGLEYSRSYGFLQDQLYFHQLQSQLYQDQNRWTELIVVFEEAQAIRDSILSIEKTKAIEELRIQYESEKKEQQILNLEQEKKIAELEIKNQYSWTIGVVVAFLIALIVGYIAYRNRTLLLAQQKLLVEHQLLRSQMNPHFLFNALGAIHSYIFKGEKKEAAEYLSTFGALTRDILDHSAQDWITIKKEIDTLKKYIEVQQLRFSSVSYELNVDPELDTENLLVPPMLLQPFVENSFEHGFKGREKSNIWIAIKRDKDQLQIEIKDDGIGLGNGNSEHKSRAIAISQERLKLLFPNKITHLSVKNREDQNGVVVNIVIPKEDTL